MVQIIRNPEIAAPVPLPFKSTLLDHATVGADLKHFGVRSDDALWESYNALDVGLDRMIGDAASYCDTSDREYGSSLWVPGLAFVLQTGVKCSAVGLDRERMVRETQRIYGAVESRAIEAVLEASFATGSAGDDPVFPTEQVGQALTLNVAQALALLEATARSTYAGLPVIHVTPFVASLLGDRIVWNGDLAYTRLGSKVVIANGYVTDDTGTVTLYATGEIYVERSEQIEVTFPVSPGSSVATSGSIEDNDALADLTRMYRVAIDPLREDGVAVLAAEATWSE